MLVVLLPLTVPRGNIKGVVPLIAGCLVESPVELEFMIGPFHSAVVLPSIAETTGLPDVLPSISGLGDLVVTLVGSGLSVEFVEFDGIMIGPLHSAVMLPSIAETTGLPVVLPSALVAGSVVAFLEGVVF